MLDLHRGSRVIPNPTALPVTICRGILFSVSGHMNHGTVYFMYPHDLSIQMSRLMSNVFLLHRHDKGSRSVNSQKLNHLQFCYNRGLSKFCICSFKRDSLKSQAHTNFVYMIVSSKDPSYKSFSTASVGIRIPTRVKKTNFWNPMTR